MSFILSKKSKLVIIAAGEKEGYFPGYKMIQFGLRKGDKLD